MKNEHPGKFIKEMFLDRYGLSVRQTALLLNVAPSTFNNVIRGRANISPEMALRLSKCFGFSADAYLRLQYDYDLELAKLNVDLSLVKNYLTEINNESP